MPRAMAPEIPANMQAVMLAAYGPPPFRLSVESCGVPTPGRNEVLVRVAASPVNPSDLLFLEGRYAYRKHLPAIPGLEGCGRVVATGPGLLARRLAGKRVSFAPAASAGGTWAQYAVAAPTQCFVLPDRIDDKQGASGLVNPLAAVGLVERVMALKSKAMISTAAASALGQMLRRLARRRGIHVINVVRRSEQVALIEGQGADHVVDTSEANFSHRLKELVDHFGARVALDAVGGTLTDELLAALPSGGRLVLYGYLSGQAGSLNPAHIIFGNKAIEGFYVPTWLASKSLPQLILLQRRVTHLLDSDLSTVERTHVGLKDSAEAVALYQRSMTGGKVLILPNGE
ncbi:MAG TPA: zinc-binding dehydrogenase [Candidatus Dormibacteraeota bacterium]|nr:zinc-binding dehydrogenase [Candidatus Dormibacteraeota bacterium]